MMACSTTYTAGPPCQSESVATDVVMACVHEHFRTGEMCGDCLRRMRKGAPIGCVECFSADGHWCALSTVRIEAAS